MDDRRVNQQTFSHMFNLQGGTINISDIHVGTHTECSATGRHESKGRQQCEPISKERVRKIAQKIKHNLIHRFENIKLPGVWWMQGKDFLMEKYTRLELRSEDGNESKKEIELQNIFDGVANKKSARILIESQPGFGKTTLAHKIVDDWVKEQTKSQAGYLQKVKSRLFSATYVRKFKLVILIVLRHLKSKTLKDFLAEVIISEDYDKDEAWKVINSEETLLVLDGLDELDIEQRSNVTEILYDVNNAYKMTIVATCRSGLSKSSETELESLFKGVATKKDFWNKKITILGIFGVHRREFIEKFIGETDDKIKIIARVENIINDRDTMFQSPLLLILLIYVICENDEDAKLDSDTDLYKNLVDCIIKRSVKKNNTSSTMSLSLFDKSCAHDCKLLLYDFGKLALDHILNDNLQFEHGIITNAVYELGFLLKHEITHNFKTVVHYEGFHLTIVEFAVSFYFLEEFCRNENRFSLKLIQKINEICFKKRSSSMVVPFLCGLLGYDVTYLFDSLSRHRDLFDRKLIEYMLRECKMTDAISEHFASLCPTIFTVFEASSRLILESQYFRKYLTDLHIDVSFVWDITFPISVNNLFVNLSRRSIQQECKNWSQIAQNIKCKTLIFILVYVLPYETLERNIKLLVEIQSEFKYLHILPTANGNYLDIKQCFDNGVLNGLKLDLLNVWLSTKCVVDVVEQILINIPVKSLLLRFANNASDMTFAVNLITTAVASSDTNSLIIANGTIVDTFCLDFDLFTKNCDKEWQLLRIDNVITRCKYPYSNNPNIKSISINSTKNCSTLVNDINVLWSINPTRLHCNYHVLEVLSNDARELSWSGWNSVVDLILTIDNSSNCFNDLSKFVSVKTVRLEIIYHPGEQKLLNILRCLKSMDIDRLEIKWTTDYDVNDFLYNLQSEISFGKIVVMEIVMNSLIRTRKSRQFNFETVTSILKCDSKIIFRLVFLYTDDFRDFIAENFVDLQNFNIAYRLEQFDWQNPIVIYNDQNDLKFGTGYQMLELTLQNFVVSSNVLAE